MTMRRGPAWLVFCALLWLGCSNPTLDSGKQGQLSDKDATPLMVYAAASMRDVLVEVAQAFKRAGGGEVAFNFAGSNALAQQIAAAPGADLFIAANGDWVGKLEKGGRLVPRSTRVVVANSLVVIAHETRSERLARIEDLPSLSFTYLAVGDPSAVPAGTYAREYLSSVRSEGEQDVWTRVRARVAPAPDVRAALAMVEANPDVLGVVYRTDALASARVKVLLDIPVDGPGATVRYYAALVKSSAQVQRAGRLLAFLTEDTAQGLFEKHGFLRVDTLTATSAPDSREHGAR